MSRTSKKEALSGPRVLATYGCVRTLAFEEKTLLEKPERVRGPIDHLSLTLYGSTRGQENRVQQYLYDFSSIGGHLYYRPHHLCAGLVRARKTWP